MTLETRQQMIQAVNGVKTQIDGVRDLARSGEAILLTSVQIARSLQDRVKIAREHLDAIEHIACTEIDPGRQTLRARADTRQAAE